MRCFWDYYLFSLLQIFPLISCRVLPADSFSLESPREVLGASPKLSKRTQINLNGFPVAGTNGPRLITNDDVESFIDQIADLAQYVVDNVRPNHATFLRFFGGNTYYNEAMTVFRRIANIRNQPGPSLNINMLANTAPAAAGADGQPGTVVGEYGQVNGQATLNLFPYWTALRDVMTLVPGQTAPGQLERFAQTRQAALAHELFHWAGDPTIFGNLVDPNQHPGFPLPELQRIVDILMEHPAEGADYAFLNENGIRRGEGHVAYGERNVLLLAQLQDGEAFAIRNADTYTQFLIAVYANFNTRRVPPTHGNLPGNWDGSDFGDPFGGTHPPFGNIPGGRTLPGTSRDRVGVIWGMFGRVSGELKA